MRFVALWAFEATLSITRHYMITKDFSDTSNKGKMNNNICCSFEEFDILIKSFTDAIDVPLISKGGHKTKLTLSKQTVTPSI